MALKNRTLIRKQLDQRLQLFAALKDTQPPMRGWIRAIRDALGMTGKQLARRLGVQKQRIAALEKGEVEGTVTINSMRKAAGAMDCVLVYALVPRDSLQAYVGRQAKKYAEKIHSDIQHSMLLEQQGLRPDEVLDSISANTEKFVRETTRDMWALD